MALPKINRVKNKKDFDFIFKNGKGLKGALFVLKIINNNSEASRFGFIVSGKVSKKAVERNRIRRRASEIIRLNLKQIKGGFDIVFVALPGAKTANYQNIEKNIMNLLTEAKIISKNV